MLKKDPIGEDEPTGILGIGRELTIDGRQTLVIAADEITAHKMKQLSPDALTELVTNFGSHSYDQVYIITSMPKSNIIKTIRSLIVERKYCYVLRETT